MQCRLLPMSKIAQHCRHMITHHKYVHGMNYIYKMLHGIRGMGLIKSIITLIHM